MCPPPERTSFGVSAARALLPTNKYENQNIRKNEYMQIRIYSFLKIMMRRTGEGRKEGPFTERP
jgi:hypothetical protein